MSKRVLVIDDRQELLALIRMLLEDAEYGVSVLSDGSLVEETARRAHPDLIVLDMRLGAISGLDVLERLRTNQATADIPVIVATAAMTDADVVERLIGDPSGRYANISVLKKPFDGDALLERIQIMIGIAEAG
ncbi:MAG TPA: response regulator [Ktedonobacterales bacterium]|nr:response regulator [Ktedonobacterales bacterium]